MKNTLIIFFCLFIFGCSRISISPDQTSELLSLYKETENMILIENYFIAKEYMSESLRYINKYQETDDQKARNHYEYMSKKFISLAISAYKLEVLQKEAKHLADKKKLLEKL